MAASSCWNTSSYNSRRCSPSDIRIYQSSSGYTSLNIPKYIVQIINEAEEVDGVFDVEITCEDFASANLVNPLVFRRLDQGHCLVKNGDKIEPGEIISFEYSNISPYQFSVIDVKC
ncbi:OLC1v1035218C2 [Oldenlandia corymbosa var. corymbosa]|uniref:OLC1v1035218C2 n=1 Tax=Oldenlandia corymbosa var. corymbosa TaxID=529605 RepID=A0AAV1CSF5_OLDCO|nr:OLC1v1035218C2 [Oldenlandia corymbosa var. corymbosa]